MYCGVVYNNFQVSNFGALKNIKTGTIYKQYINKQGYSQVCVSLGSRNKKKIFKIHRAVAETFIPNPENKREVNHKDGYKQNNTVLNLEWVTPSENMQHAYDIGLAKPKSGVDNVNAKLTEEDVRYIREHYISNDSNYSSRALGKKFNVDHMQILRIVNKKRYINV